MHWLSQVEIMLIIIIIIIIITMIVVTKSWLLNEVEIISLSQTFRRAVVFICRYVYFLSVQLQ